MRWPGCFKVVKNVPQNDRTFTQFSDLGFRVLHKEAWVEVLHGITERVNFIMHNIAQEDFYPTHTLFIKDDFTFEMF